jgi:hypothetical protein
MKSMVFLRYASSITNRSFQVRFDVSGYPGIVGRSRSRFSSNEEQSLFGLHSSMHTSFIALRQRDAQAGGGKDNPSFIYCQSFKITLIGPTRKRVDRPVRTIWLSNATVRISGNCTTLAFVPWEEVERCLPLL